jgi:hypothetical protein
MSLSPSSILVGGTTQATAVAKDAQGAVIAGKAANWSVSNSLATVSSSGLVTALAAGTVLVTANIDGKSASGSLTISNPPTQTTPSAGAELPRTFLNYSLPATTGQIIVVPAGGNLQTALNNAQRGDEIVLAAGATYTGNFTLPAKPGSAANGWIKIRTDKHSQLPAIGTRVHASNAALMPKVVTPNTAPAIRLAAGASGWWISGIEVTVTASVTQQQYGLIFLGESRDLQTTMASVPQDVVLDRMYIHGQPTTNLSRCVALNSGRTQISDSYIVECHGKGFDSQAVAGWNGPGPYKIVNNALQGAGENLMFGGSDPGIPGLVPSDIEIRRNHLYTPVAWKGVWTKKNLFESKNAVRVLVEGNVFDGSWSDGQTGWAIALKSTNQSGGCPWCRTTDVTIRRNLIQNAGAGVSVAPRDTHTGVDTTARRILVTESVFDNIGVGAFTGDKRGFMLLKNTADITIENTVVTGSLQAALLLDDAPGTQRARFANNVWTYGQYGTIATGAGPGTPSVTVGAPGAIWEAMTFVGPQRAGYPIGTGFVSSESHATLAQRIRSLVQAATAGVVVP